MGRQTLSQEQEELNCPEGNRRSRNSERGHPQNWILGQLWGQVRRLLLVKELMKAELKLCGEEAAIQRKSRTDSRTNEPQLPET